MATWRWTSTAEQQAQAEHQRQHGRAAVGDQRQRHADDGDQAGHHRDVDGDVDEQVEHHADREQAGELAGCPQRDHQAQQDHEQEEAEDRDGADEAQLLGQHGEGEVGVLLGQEAELGLAAVQKPLPQKPPEPSAILDWMMW